MMYTNTHTCSWKREKFGLYYISYNLSSMFEKKSEVYEDRIVTIDELYDIVLKKFHEN